MRSTCGFNCNHVVVTAGITHSERSGAAFQIVALEISTLNVDEVFPKPLSGKGRERIAIVSPSTTNLHSWSLTL